MAFASGAARSDPNAQHQHQASSSCLSELTNTRKSGGKPHRARKMCIERWQFNPNKTDEEERDKLALQNWPR